MSGKHRPSIKFSQGWSTPRVAKADHPGDPAPGLNHLRNHHHPGDLVSSPEPETLWKPPPSENTLLFNVKWTLLRIPSLMSAMHVAFCDSSVLRWCIVSSIRCVALCYTEHHTACTCLELCFWSPPCESRWWQGAQLPESREAISCQALVWNRKKIPEKARKDEVRWASPETIFFSLKTRAFGYSALWTELYCMQRQVLEWRHEAFLFLREYPLRKCVTRHLCMFLSV